MSTKLAKVLREDSRQAMEVTTDPIPEAQAAVTEVTAMLDNEVHGQVIHARLLELISKAILAYHKRKVEDIKMAHELEILSRLEVAEAANGAQCKTIAALQEQYEYLRQLSGKGRWCPSCDDWLMDPDSALGDTCGTCHTKIEHKRLALLRGERDALRTRTEKAETRIRMDTETIEHIKAELESFKDLQQDVRPLLYMFQQLMVQAFEHTEKDAQITLETFLAKHPEFAVNQNQQNT